VAEKDAIMNKVKEDRSRKHRRPRRIRGNHGIYPRTLHRREWPGFLNRVVSPAVWQAFGAQVGRFEDPRVRWVAKYIVLAWLLIGWSIQRQLTERFREAWEFLGRWFARRRRPGASYQGLTRASQRVGLDAIHKFWECLRPTAPQWVGPAWNWFGWIVMAADGSRIDAPRTSRNQKALPRGGRDQSHPQWQITWLTHLPTNLIWDWRQGPGNSAERVHLREMIGSVPKPLLLVADAGFGGFDLLWTLSDAGIDFLIRCAGNTTLLVEGTFQRMVRQGGQLYVYLWPHNRRSKRPLRLRLIILKRAGKRIYLLTNVLDSTRLSRPMASKVYAARWGVETEYRALKQTMDHRKLLAKTPEPGAMELAGNILGLALLVLQAAIVMASHVPRLSIALALKVIRYGIEAVRWVGRFCRFWELLRAAVKDEYRRHSAKRTRPWPDKKKESPPSPPKLRRLSRQEKARIQCLADDCAIVFG
jgi:hypothetical protein